MSPYFYAGKDHCLPSGDYEILTIEDQDSFKWAVHLKSEMPQNDFTVDDISDLLIGRTVANPKISIEVTFFDYRSINLPYEIFDPAQSLGMHNISVWYLLDGKEYAFKFHEC